MISHRAVLTRFLARRKTGVFLKDTGARDEHGMQPLDDIFSSPEKDSQNGAEDDEDEESDEEPMDIDESEPAPSWERPPESHIFSERLTNAMPPPQPPAQRHQHS